MKKILNIYKKFLLIRSTDEEIAKKYSEWKMRCPTHLSVRQEAISAVFSTLVKKKDYAISMHRPHTHYLAKGGNLNKMISELYGKETTLPWGVKFEKIDEIYRHPSQLYEAFFEGLILFFILIFFRKSFSAKNPGFISGIFLIFYSAFRFIIEFFRIPDEQLGYILFNFSMGQILCLVFFIFGSYLTLKKYDHQK